MKRSRATEEQVVAVSREAGKPSAAAAAEEHEASEQTIGSWRWHLTGLEPSDVKKPKALESENATLNSGLPIVTSNLTH